jgi:hypothetical protein
MMKMLRVASLWIVVLVAMPTLAAEQGEGAKDAAQNEGPAVVTSPAAAPNSEAEGREVPRSDASRKPPAANRAAPSTDRLELDTSVVTGNRELPKVLYIVPWKKADLGDLPGQPFNSLLDEVLTPVDRDVFRREVTYFEAVTEGANATQSTSPSPR